MKNAIILASHGDFAVSALESLEMIIGELPNIKALSLTPGFSLSDFINMMESAYSSLDRSNGTFIFTDIYGGTPSNAATIMLTNHQGENIKAYSGLNLPVLLENAMFRELSFEEFTKKINETSSHTWTELQHIQNGDGTKEVEENL